MSDTVPIIVINSIPPYCFESNSIVGLPHSFLFRLRFREKWMPNTDENGRDFETSNLEGRDAVIALRKFETGEMFPIRRVEVLQITTIGDTHYIEFRLKDLTDLSPSDKGGTTIESFHTAIEDSVGKDIEDMANEQLDHHIIYVKKNLLPIGFNDSTSSQSKNQEVLRWGNIVTVLASEFDEFDNFGFFKIHGISEEYSYSIRGDEEDLKIETSTNTSYAIRSEKNYQLGIIHRSFVDDGTNTIAPKIKIRHGNELLFPISEKNAFGEYDYLSFVFECQDATSSSDSFILIDIEDEQFDNTPPSAEIPLELVRSRRDRMISGAALGFSIIGIFLILIPGMIGSASGIRELANNPNRIEQIGIIIAILALSKVRYRDVWNVLSNLT